MSQPEDIEIEAAISRPVKNLVWDEVAGKWIALDVKDATEATLGGNAVKLTHDPNLDTGGASVTILGSQGVPITQDEKSGEEFGYNSLFVTDLDLQTVLGTQSLLSLGRLMVEDGYREQIVQGILRTAVVNTEVIFGCEGFNSLTIELSPAQAAAWTGTVTFEGQMGQTWYAMIYASSTAITVPVATTTASGIFRFNIAGYTKFRARCSTVGTLNAFVVAKLSTAPGVAPLTTPVTGSLLQSLSQKATTFELNTYDTGVAATVTPNTALLQNALTALDPYYRGATYNIGDSILWGGQIWRCILGTSTVSPPTAANWVVDDKQPKSLVTKDVVSPVNTPRLKVEIDQDDYQIRMSEETLLVAKMDMQSRIISQEYQQEVLQAGVSNGIYYGKAYSTGQNAIFEEIR